MSGAAVQVPASDLRRRCIHPGKRRWRAGGWRVAFPLHQASKQDEVLSFLGASYFRGLGARQRYGLSARALAIDTVGDDGEEFPAFTAFWL